MFSFTKYFPSLSLINLFQSSTLNSVVNLSETASLNHINTIIDGNIDNVDNVSVVNVGTAIGYRMGFNTSPIQVFGTFQASGTGCSLSGGVGQQCTAGPITIKGIPSAQTSTAYTVNGCTLVGASGYAIPATITTKDPGTFYLAEINLQSGAVSGGTIQCTVQF